MSEEYVETLRTDLLGWVKRMCTIQPTHKIAKNNLFASPDLCQVVQGVSGLVRPKEIVSELLKLAAFVALETFPQKHLVYSYLVEELRLYERQHELEKSWIKGSEGV